MSTNQYGGGSVPWPLPKKLLEQEYVYDLEGVPAKHICRDVAKAALNHLDLHPDAALLAYRLLSQRFAISG
mgnify:CR=1 FL=1